jgi:hypothetical protein
MRAENRPMSKLAILAVVAAAALVPAAARASGTNAGTETVSAGPVTATLAWDSGENGPLNTRLAISRGGAVVFNRAIPRVCGSDCEADIPESDAFQLIDLDGDGEPEVALTTENGECCDQTLGIYGFDRATGSYGELAQRMGESLLSIKDVDDNGSIEIVATDQRFKNLVPGHTSLFFPPVVYRYEHPATGPRLVDRTRSSISVVSDAADELKFVLSDLKDADAFSKMYVGSYVAEEFMLGHGKAGLKEFDRQAKRGTLGNAKSVKKFRKRLLRLLHQYGYR